jgi:hypothetical protein
MTELEIREIARRRFVEHMAPFHNWIRSIVNLSAGALTLLVGLQGQYVGPHSQGLWLLRLSWGILASTILTGVFALMSEWRTPLDAGMNLWKVLREDGVESANRYLEDNPMYSPRKSLQAAVLATFFLFCFSVVSIAVFAIWNLGS